MTPAEQADLIRVDASEVRFRHPLIRSAVYGTTTFAERSAVHRALADTLKQSGEVDRYAWHLAAATLEPDEMVAAELEQAAAPGAGTERVRRLRGRGGARGRALALPGREGPEADGSRLRRVADRLASAGGAADRGGGAARR